MRGAGRTARLWRRAAAVLLLGLAGLPPVRVWAAGGAGGGGERLLVLQAAGDLEVFRLPEQTRLGTVALGGRPERLAATPDGRKAYVTDPGRRLISVVDLVRLRVARLMRAEGIDRPGDLAVTPDGRSLLVASPEGGRLILIDARRDVMLRSVTTTQKGAHTLALYRDGRRALVTNRLSGSVSILDLPALKILRHLKVGPDPEGIAASPNGRWAIIGLPKAGQVALVDLNSQQSLGRLPAGATPLALSFTPNSFNAIVVNRDSGDASILDVLGRRLRKTLPVGRRPTGLALDASGRRAYVCNSESGTVTVLNLAGLDVGGSIAVGGHPVAVVVAASPATSRAPARRHGGAWSGAAP